MYNLLCIIDDISFKVDLNTFMTLTDEDLKELGVATFGARKRMILAIQGNKFDLISTYAYYLRKVWVYALSAEGPLN